MPVSPGLGLFNSGDKAGNIEFVIRGKAVNVTIFFLESRKVHMLNHMVNHALKSPSCPVFGRIYLGYAVCFYFSNFFGYDNPAAAAKNLNMRSAGFF